MFKFLADLMTRLRHWLFASKEEPPGRLRPTQEAIVRLASTEDPEPAVRAGKFVLVGPVEQPKWLMFQCPCGCGGEVRLNLMKKFRPRWTVEYAESGITVHPSIDMQTCGAHFWVRRGAIVWAGSRLDAR